MEHLPRNFGNYLRYYFIDDLTFDEFSNIFLPKLTPGTRGSGKQYPMNLETGHVIDLLNCIFPCQFRHEVELCRGTLKLYCKADELDQTAINFLFVTNIGRWKRKFSGTISSKEGFSIKPGYFKNGVYKNHEDWNENKVAQWAGLGDYLMSIGYFEPVDEEQDQIFNVELKSPDWYKVFDTTFLKRSSHEENEALLDQLKVVRKGDNLLEVMRLMKFLRSRMTIHRNAIDYYYAFLSTRGADIAWVADMPFLDPFHACRDRKLSIKQRLKCWYVDVTWPLGWFFAKHFGKGRPCPDED